MSFTLYHTKRDGSKEAIKMSIFDAFRGVPDPKPRKPKERMCPCCGKPHTSKTEVTGGKKDKGKDAKGKEKAKPEGKDGEETDDQIILRMKAANPEEQWETILKATKGFKTNKDIKARFNEIKDQKSAVKEKSKDSEEGNKNGQDDDKAAKKAKNKEEGMKKQAEAKAKKEAQENAKAGETGEDAKTDNKEHKSQKKSANKGKDSGDDTNAFKVWANEYDKKKWQTLASKHYDRTGERITADEARKMAEGK
ncbi:hypothetical protein LTR10_011493 [Elasticomyces elasticus]|uniref:Myb-like domain-containing protein n=1 Tax=Exophiala sideris TaxID=1016849 RepID=A0ABR0JD97_9EURO|nr:hypothetical protein LTR10_011493 [Elasticomyces elasticus]KAK5032051.1 hypothetical protein LTS07_004673 [Exophiala sideris]KAK5040979.1 hypothetical protein LTR13_003281 [Exophiala sideris]KAK5061687.1 hypothetical protein LTR69_004869 [Exophiala sideris]KAK5184387.1 hypothetical protein LTR44_003060 [Eurotiomycetes sp. CCFEE 6388]